MTARKYTVSKRGVKREARSPRLTAREQLLQYVGGDGSVDYMGEDARKHTRTVRRLLRAHERELAERAVRQHRAEMGWRAHRSSDDSIRAAILKRSDTPKATVPPAAGPRKRGER